MSKDYYKILGVSKDASKEEIKKSFRKLAHEYHPDKGGNQEKFKEISEAYSILSDDNKRAQYDQYGSAFGQGQSGGAGFNGGGGFEGFDFSGFQNGGGFEGFDVGDIFGDFFGGSRAKPKRGRDISTELDLSFEEAVFGVERKIFLNKTSTCDVCSGTGAKVGTEFSTCKMCNGKGKVQQLKRTILGQIATTKTCEDCHGKGKIPKEKCTNCYGSGVVAKESEISLKIPAGINDGDTMRMTGAGEAISGGATGDLYVKIYVKKHHLFKRDGNDLVMDLKIKLTDAILGAEYKIQTLDGEIILKIPEGVTHGEILRVRGKGIPNERGKRGDILIKIQIHIPNKMNKEGKKLVEEMKKLGL